MSAIRNIAKGLGSGAAVGAATGAVAGGLGTDTFGGGVEGMLYGAAFGATGGGAANLMRRMRAPGRIQKMGEWYKGARGEAMGGGAGLFANMRRNRNLTNIQTKFQRGLVGVNRGLRGGFMTGGAVGGLAGGGFAMLPSNTSAGKTYSEATLSERLAYDRARARAKAQEQMRVFQSIRG